MDLDAIGFTRPSSWLADKLDAIVDPEFAAIYRDCDSAFDWSPTSAAARVGCPPGALARRSTRTDRPGKSVDPKIARLAEMLTHSVITSLGSSRRIRLAARRRRPNSPIAVGEHTVDRPRFQKPAEKQVDSRAEERSPHPKSESGRRPRDPMKLCAHDPCRSAADRRSETADRDASSSTGSSRSSRPLGSIRHQSGRGY